MNEWLAENLMCPRHGIHLRFDGDNWNCAKRCSFPSVDGVPVLLLDEVRHTMDLAKTSLQQCRSPNTDGGLYVESLGLSDDEKRGILELASSGTGEMDPVVSFLVGATNGIAYKDQIGTLSDYPIPKLRLPPSDGKVFLDVGCNWGRWCVAASLKGYTVVGIDPSLGAVMAAKRVARNLGVNFALIVGDARYLPIMPSVIDCAFSYSVLQHLSQQDAAQVVSEVGRVLKHQGTALVQMPTKFGIRCLYHQVRRRFREGVDFEVRYWSLPSLRRLFSVRIGPTKISADCYFGIGLQFSDLRFFTPMLRIVVTMSESIRRISRLVTPLVWVADSVYISSSKSSPAEQGGAADDQPASRLVRR